MKNPFAKKKEEEKKGDEKKDDKDKEDEDEDGEDDGNGVFFADDEDGGGGSGGNTLNADVTKLHRFLSSAESPSIRDDYQRKRRWRFAISKITFQNDSDAKLSLFVALTVTDERPAPPALAGLHEKLCGASVPLEEIRAVTRYSPAITNINPQQRVTFPGTLAFQDWGITKEAVLGCLGVPSSSSEEGGGSDKSSGGKGGGAGGRGVELLMSYADILRRSLKVEMWEYKAYGAHILLGSSMLPFSSIVHSPPPRELFIRRNVAPTARGRSTNVGLLTFNAILEEAQLRHQLSLKCWSIALSNALGHPSFRHPASADCSGPCCCAALTCCCDTPKVADTLQQWGYGERVSVAVGAPGAYISLKGSTTSKKTLGFSAPMNTHGMAAASATPSHRLALIPDGLDEALAAQEMGGGGTGLNKGGKGAAAAAAAAAARGGSGSGGVGGVAASAALIKAADLTPSPVPVNDSISYSELRMVGDPQQSLTMNCSRSTLEARSLDVTVKLRCRRCFSTGYGKAKIPLSGVSVSTFLPVSAPIVFQRAVGLGLCNILVTGGVLRGFLQWKIEDAPLMHHFTQPGGSVGTSSSSGGKGKASRAKVEGFLSISVREVRRLPNLRSKGTVDPRVTVTWAGQTLTTATKLGTENPIFEQALNFPLPRLSGRSVDGDGIGPADLLLPLESYRYALVRVWDDASYANLQPQPSGGGGDDDDGGAVSTAPAGPQGMARFVRSTELLAEGLVEVPIAAILGLSGSEGDDSAAGGAGGGGDSIRESIVETHRESTAAVSVVVSTAALQLAKALFVAVAVVKVVGAVVVG
jgi:C2 domain